MYIYIYKCQELKPTIKLDSINDPIIHNSNNNKKQAVKQIFKHATKDEEKASAFSDGALEGGKVSTLRV